MDKETVIKVLQRYYFNKSVPYSESVDIISSYYIEQGKSNEDISKMISTLMSNNYLLSIVLTTALQHFKIKFNICELWSAPNPLNNQGEERKIISIF